MGEQVRFKTTNRSIELELCGDYNYEEGGFCKNPAKHFLVVKRKEWSESVIWRYCKKCYLSTNSSILLIREMQKDANCTVQEASPDQIKTLMTIEEIIL